MFYKYSWNHDIDNKVICIYITGVCVYGALRNFVLQQKSTIYWDNPRISSDIRSEILFYGDGSAEPQNIISERVSDDIPPQMRILNIVITILMYFLTFTRQNPSAA